MGLIALTLLVSTFPITGNYQLKVVKSGSMEPAIKTGSVVVVKPVDQYKIQDVITFINLSKKNEPVTHRIIDIEVIEGNPFYITQGDANNAPDQRTIPQKEIVGKVLFSIPYLGYAVDAAKKPLGFILIIAIPAAIIIYDELRKVWREIARLKNKKKDMEQDNQIKELKDKIEELEKDKDKWKKYR